MTGRLTLVPGTDVPDVPGTILSVLEGVMAFQPAPAVAQAVLRFGQTTGGVFTHANVLNVRHQDNVAWNVADLEGLTSALMQWFAGWGEDNMSAVYQLLSIEARGMESQAAAYTSLAVNDAGVATGDPLPPNVAACITLYTDVTGRSGRGRMYWGGLSESQSGGASLNSGNVTGINDMATALLTTIDEETVGNLCVLSRYSNGVARANALPIIVTSASLRDSVLDTQRRRINRLKV